jgi:GTP1/Obg family GTP-binding protein
VVIKQHTRWCEYLELPSLSKLDASIATLAKTVAKIPRLESFVRKIAKTMNPQLRKNEDPDVAREVMNTLIPKLQTIRKDASEYTKFKEMVRQLLDIDCDETDTTKRVLTEL